MYIIYHLNYLKLLNKKTVNIFSIPFGGQGTYNKDTISIIKDLGYKGVLLSSGKVNTRNSFFDFGTTMVDRFSPKNDIKLFMWALLTGKS